MAEVRVSKPVPGQAPGEDVEVGYIIDEITPGVQGRLIGIYGRNSTPDLVRVEMEVGNWTRHLDLPSGTPAAQRLDFPNPARVFCTWDGEDGVWEVPFTRFVIWREFK